MWRKQTEGKPASTASGTHESPAYVPPASSAPATSNPLQSVASPPRASGSSSDVTVLTRGIRLKGHLSGKGEITIDGELSGSVHVTEAIVAIGPNGHVKADIEAREVIVRGIVEGNLRGRDRVVLGSTGNVRGDIDAARVAIEDGAVFKGRVEIGRETLQRQDREAQKKPVAAPAAPAPAPVASAPKPAQTAPSATPPKPATTPLNPAAPATTGASSSSNSSASVSSPQKDSASVPAPAGVPGGSR